MGSITSKNRGGKFLFCAVDVLPNMHGLKLYKIKKLKRFLMLLLK